MTYYANNQKEYRKKLLQFQLRYFLNDKKEGERLQSYLKNVNMSYSNYIKQIWTQKAYRIQNYLII